MEEQHQKRTRINSFLSLQRNVLVLSATGLLINFGAQAFQPFIPLYLESLKANIPQIGIVYVGMAIATNLVSIPGGFLADKFGRKTIIVIGNALGFGLYLSLVDTTTWTGALVILFSATVFVTLVQPAASSTVAESVDVKDRSSAYGTFFVLVYLGLAFGSMVGGFLPNPGKYEWNIILIALVGLTAALGRFIFLKETLPKHARSSGLVSGRRFFLVRLSRNVWLILLALLAFNFLSGLGQPLYAIFATKQLHLSEAEFAVMIGLGYLASMIGAFGAGRVSRSLGVRNMLIFGVILAGVLLIPWIYAPNVILAISTFAASGFFAQFFFVGSQTMMANVTIAEERSSVIGFITTVAGLGSIAAPYAGSELWVLVDPKIPFLVSAILAGVVAIPIALMHDSKLLYKN
jgi:MFS family permease